MTTLSTGAAFQKEDAIRWAWTHGLLKYKMHDGQLALDEKIQELEGRKNRDRPFLLWARQTGKTTWEVISFEEFARQNAGSVQRFAGPTQKQVVSTILPIWRIIAADCPKDLRVRYSQREGCYIWPNESRLFIAGTRTEEDVDRLRGPFSHRTYVDEMAFHQCDLNMLVNQVLSPQLNSTGGLLIQSTTPPNSMAHESIDFIHAAERADTIYKMSVDKCPLYSSVEIKRSCELSNPEASPSDIQEILSGVRVGTPLWRREYLCELVPDERVVVVPDFRESAHIINTYAQSTDVQRLVFIDQGGTVDFFAVVFCEYDARAHMLTVVDEYQCRRTSTDAIAKALLAKERALRWLPPGAQATARRYANDPRGEQQRIDLKERGYHTVLGRKSQGAEAEADRLTVAFRENRVRVHARCKELIAQLKYGIWDLREKSGKADYLRTELLGHLDAMAALASGLSEVPWKSKPPAPGKQRLTYGEEPERDARRRKANSLVFGGPR